ncbi:MAG: cyclic nucleotide-binding domain-containing protein [Betaproteobacteria bacterium]|nr:cyclic nucleotide-binding domain-containing protein [Betaproteobacteria bacterium]
MSRKSADALLGDPSSVLPFRAGSGFYNPEIAKAFFKAYGKKAEFPAGTILFLENDKSKKKSIFKQPLAKALKTSVSEAFFAPRRIHRMFFLASGEVALTQGGRLLHKAQPGDVFGEMAVISELPDPEFDAVRSASAEATEDCMAYSLDGAEVQEGLRKKPEFVLMLLSVMFERLRMLAGKLSAHGDDVDEKTSRHRSRKAESILDPAMLAALRDKLDVSTVVHFQEGKKILKAGVSGTTMYVVLEGQVAVAIGRKIVEKIEAGGFFGEMALVDQLPRTATAVARTDCSLLPINREALIKLVKTEPDFGMALMRSVAQRLQYMNSLFG